MNRDIWKSKSFTDSGHFPCPKCFTGVLIGQNRLTQITEGGKEMSEYGYPYGIDNLFCGILKCNNPKCIEVISVSGLYLTNIQSGRQLPDGSYIEESLSYYNPKFFYPNLRFFNLPVGIPKEIRDQIDLAFSLYFYDNNSCANKIRTAIELVLDHIRAPKRKKNKNGKLVTIPNLHQRIKNFSKAKPKLCELFLALKIIGNEGSHTNNTQTDDVLDAFEILEMVLEKLYIKSDKRVENIAKSKIKKTRL